LVKNTTLEENPYNPENPNWIGVEGSGVGKKWRFFRGGKEVKSYPVNV